MEESSGTDPLCIKLISSWKPIESIQFETTPLEFFRVVIFLLHSAVVV